MKHQKIRWKYNKYSMCIYIYMFTSTVVDQVLVTPPSWSVSKHETGHGFGENAMSNDLKKFLRSKKATASVFCFWWKYHQSRYRNLRYRLILKQRRRWYRGRAIPWFCSARKVCNQLELSHEKIRSTFHYTVCLIGIEINGLLMFTIIPTKLSRMSSAISPINIFLHSNGSHFLLAVQDTCFGWWNTSGLQAGQGHHSTAEKWD